MDTVWLSIKIILKYDFEFKILCPIADKGKSTGKDKITMWGGAGGGEAGGKGLVKQPLCLWRSSEECTNRYNRIRLWKYKKMGQKRNYKRARKKLLCSSYPHEPWRPTSALFDGWMLNKTACEEPYSLQLAEIFHDFIGAHNKQSICGLMPKIKLQHIVNHYDNKRCTCHVPK